LSPLEFARYIDEFESPWIRSTSDVGNVRFTDIRKMGSATLGPRIRQAAYQGLFLAELVASGKRSRGDIDWSAIYVALNEIGLKEPQHRARRRGRAVFERNVPAIEWDLSGA